MEDSFPRLGVGWGCFGDGLGMIRGHYFYCALYFQSHAAANLTGDTGLHLEAGDLCYKLYVRYIWF